MVSIDEYRTNPCKVYAIPYWKMRSFDMPNNILVIHNENYNKEIYNEYNDIQYFRLIHKLKEIKQFNLDKKFEYRKVDVSNDLELQRCVDIINKCYTDIKVDLEQVTTWTKSEVFNGDLWIYIVDIDKQKIVALGIADLDAKIHEGMLEWIQVMPEYRGQGLGQALVYKLLSNLSGKVDFVTVSGQVDNKTNPEKLYRKCGFEGNDIWHVLARK